ncbi:MAG: hypothetical protein ACREKH_10200, partial [Candidatus Rokuibacteriota bacterium]
GPTSLVTGTFAICTLAAVHSAHIMTIGYSCFAVPTLVLAGVLAMGWAWEALGPRSGWATAGCRAIVSALVVAAVIDGAHWPARDEKCTRDNGIKRVSRVLADQAARGDVVLAGQWPIVRWVVWFERGRHDIDIVPFDPSNQRTSEGQLRAVESGDFGWVLVGSRSASRFPNAPLATFVSERWDRVATDDNNVLYRNPRRGRLSE